MTYLTIRVFHRLIDAGADIFIKRYDGNSPLMIAIFSEKEEVVRCLVNQGALINEQNNEGNSPIMIAANLIDQRSDIEFEMEDFDNEILEKLILYLLDQGADLSLCNQQNKTAESLILNVFNHNEWIDEKIRTTKERFLLNQTLQEPHVNGRLDSTIKRL